MIQKAQCEIEIDRKTKAENTSKDIASLIATKEFENENVDIKTKCHDKLKQLLNKLIDIHINDTALQLIRLQFDLIKQSYKSAEKLTKLGSLGDPIQKTTKNFHFQVNAVKANECYFLLDKILHDMQAISTVDLKVKTNEIAGFMFYYGLCCNNMSDFEKSLSIHSKVIFFMKSNLGDAAKNYRLYGDCHRNFAVALFERNCLYKAKQEIEEALKIYEQAQDWGNEKQKVEVALSTTHVMHKIIEKLKV